MHGTRIDDGTIGFRSRVLPLVEAMLFVTASRLFVSMGMSLVMVVSHGLPYLLYEYALT
nr:hypothetical protein [Legionella pneumophila]